MSVNTRLCAATPEIKQLIRLMQEINFGRIIGLVIHGGVPDLSCPHRTIRTVKLSGGENGCRPETVNKDFELRKEHEILLEQLKTLSNTTRVTIEVKHGLPFLMEIEQEHRAA